MKTSVNKKSGKLFGFIATGALAVVALVFTACPNSYGGGSITPDIGSFEDSGEFIKIIPPKVGIEGKDTKEGWNGVFIKDRKVKLSSYLMGKTEVPYKLWKEVYDWATGNGYTFANEGQKGSSGSGSEDESVTRVSWRDCIVWCNAYTEKEKGIKQCVYRDSNNHDSVLKDSTDSAGAACDAAYADMAKKGFRLPTEAEWEYAARWQGDDKTNAEQYGSVWLTKLDSASGAKRNWNDEDETKEVAWYKDGKNKKTHPVGEKRANALGLSDMSGNVWEWCFDGYGSIEPGDVTDPIGAVSGDYRVFRGGSWFNDARDCVVGARLGSGPDGCGVILGFRLACRS